ncbi:heavy metal sensor histidine kinase [Glaciimonas sp. PAMC28666]|uniref:heavy metal sensor histidine kinase n=1 Tax=Glaciimonas sp. PAMC28666 TaxID=2807626 RepID=UPI00196577B6|nr:heavy metal sensor histidine kinase [Glaciimonas sp. PAMC28666]QRX84177.1 heavy metal sensor histidine kinase [Glaciimonas sp. PAMC28666]
MNLWRTRSLTVRVSFLFALIACAIVTSLGMYLYTSTRQALESRADYSLIGRVAHFRTLLHDLYNVKQMENRPTLFESMLGSEQDVLMFAYPGQAPFIRVNPDNMTPPPMMPVGLNQPLTLATLQRGERADGVRVRWISAEAQVGSDGSKVVIVGAHVMTQESQLLSKYYWQVIGAAAISVLLAALLGFLILKRGFRPLIAMAERAAEVSPTNIAIRLREEDAPQELRRLAASFNAMLDRLSDGYEHLSQFSADLAHEIRTPIGAMMGQTQVTLNKVRNAGEYQQVLESNLEELERLSRIVEDILFLAHADHAGLSVEKTPLVLAVELHKIAEYFEGMAEERDIKLVVDASGELQVNSVMWRRAVSNLAVNAVRYALPGSTVRLSGKPQAQGTCIEVENQGDPIPQEQLDRLFDRFYRGDKSRSEFTESNGLGLAIVRAIMLVHGGSAEVSCSAAGLVRFSLYFPQTPQELKALT